MNIIPNQFTLFALSLREIYWLILQICKEDSWFWRYINKIHCLLLFYYCCSFFWDPGFAALDLIINDYYMLSCAVKDALQHVPKMSSGYSSCDTKKFFHALSNVCRRRRKWRGQSPWRLKNKHIYLKFKNSRFKVCFKHIQNESNLRKILLLLFIKLFVN